MSKKYYLCVYSLENIRRYFLWYTDERDGVVLNETGKMRTFSDVLEASDYAQAQEFPIAAPQDVTRYDLNSIADWLTKPNAGAVDCNRFINAWSMFTDIAASTGSNFDPDKERTRQVYDKLFHGLNLPAVTPKGRSYEPIWLKDEIVLLCEVMDAGLKLIRKNP